MSHRPESRPIKVASPKPAYGVVRGIPFDGDEAALVAALHERRADAGAAFYDRYVRTVHGLVFRLMGPDRDIDDVVHDVFVRALESLPRLRDPAALKGWVVGIAVRTVAIRFQSRTRRRWLRFMAPEDVPEVATLAAVQATDVREAMRHVWEILRGMNPDERIALILHRVEGMPHEEAAEAAGTSVATFRRRLSRGEAKFFARAKNDPALETWIGEGTP